MSEIEGIQNLSKTLQFVKGIENDKNLTVKGFSKTDKEIKLDIVLKAGREIKQTIALLKTVYVTKLNLKNLKGKASVGEI